MARTRPNYSELDRKAAYDFLKSIGGKVLPSFSQYRNTNRSLAERASKVLTSQTGKTVRPSEVQATTNRVQIERSRTSDSFPLLWTETENSRVYGVNGKAIIYISYTLNYFAETDEQKENLVSVFNRFNETTGKKYSKGWITLYGYTQQSSEGAEGYVSCSMHTVASLERGLKRVLAKMVNVKSITVHYKREIKG